MYKIQQLYLYCSAGQFLQIIATPIKADSREKIVGFSVWFKGNVWVVWARRNYPAKLSINKKIIVYLLLSEVSDPELPLPRLRLEKSTC